MIPAASRSAGLLAGPIFVVSFLIQGVIRPGYDPLRHPVSALSLGPGGWVLPLAPLPVRPPDPSGADSPAE